MAGKLRVRKLTDVVLCPASSAGHYRAGLYGADGALEESLFYRGLGDPDARRTSRTVARAVRVSEPVLYLGVFHSVWGHCLADHLKFLWVFLHPDEHPELKGCRCVYTVLSPHRKAPEGFFRMLEAFGLGADRLTEVTKPTRFDVCYLPEESFWRDWPNGVTRLFAPEYVETLDFLVRRFDVAPTRSLPAKVYFSRTKWPCNEFGEERVEAAFRQAGYAIVHPEDLTLEETVSLLQRVESFASGDGSCAHNSVFLRPGTEMTVVKKYPRMNEYQLAIDRARNLRTTYVDAYRWFECLRVSKRKLADGPIFLYVSRALAERLGVRKPPFPLLSFVSFVLRGTWAKICRKLRRH